MKTCSSCKVELPYDEFHRNKRSSDGYQTFCKECNKESNRKQGTDVWRRANLKRNFGITVEDYDNLLQAQGGKCALCDKPAESFNKRLAVDHDHHSGIIRGLLCNYCNHRVIGRHRDASLLRRMADYVERSTGFVVPKKKRPTKRRPNRGKIS